MLLIVKGIAWGREKQNKRDIDQNINGPYINIPLILKTGILLKIRSVTELLAFSVANCPK